MKTHSWKKWLIGTGILFVIIMLVGALAGNFFYNFALNNRGSRAGSPPVDELAMRRNSDLMHWLEQTGGYTTETITSFDGLQLLGYEMINKKPSNKWIILCHGYANSANDMLEQAKHFYDIGFNILIPDARGHGLSEGNYIGMGWNERRDVVQWSNKIVEQNPEAQIALYGVSMGAATVMMAAGETDLPKQVRVVIEDCGYSSILDEFAHQLFVQFRIPSFPILNFSSLITRLRAGFWLGQGDVVKQVSQSITPILFIHGTADDYVPTAMVEEVYNAAKAPKEKLLVNGAAHAKSLKQDPKLYWDTIEKFVFKYIER